MATWSCTSHDDDDDNYDQPSITSLAGKTWTYGYNNRTGRVEFTQSGFSIRDYDGDYMNGTYNYDGETFSFTFIYDYDEEETYKLYCLTKASNSSSLQGTVWKFEKIYNGRIYSYTIYLYENSYTMIEDGDEDQGYYSYDGNTITATFEGGTYHLQCGTVLYEMAQKNTNIW